METTNTLFVMLIISAVIIVYQFYNNLKVKKHLAIAKNNLDAMAFNLETIECDKQMKISKFRHLEGLPESELSIKIILMSINDKKEFLEVLTKHSEASLNNLEAATVVQYSIEDDEKFI